MTTKAGQWGPLAPFTLSVRVRHFQNSGDAIEFGGIARRGM
jgi:hypothetical protein